MTVVTLHDLPYLTRYCSHGSLVNTLVVSYTYRTFGIIEVNLCDEVVTHTWTLKMVKMAEFVYKCNI